MNKEKIMSTLHERHFKEVGPEQTVQRIKMILKNNNIETEEIWKQDETIETNSVRVNIKGTQIGTNGKGVSKEYAMASGYAELLERLQNNILCKPLKYNYIQEDSFFVSPDEKQKSAEEIVQENSSFIKYYFDQRNMKDKLYEEKVIYFKKSEQMDYIETGVRNSYLTVPFYNIKNRTIEYIPNSIYKIAYGSNGMCAGNTPEEAIVQGLSEIYERVVQKKIFTEKITFPDIPEDYIKKFPYIYNMFSRLKNLKGYKFYMKDCSCGGKYPVAALVGIELNTGKYGVKLGCHPDYGIAMERTFTEATQGQSIFDYITSSKFDPQNDFVDDKDNIMNSFKIGKAQYPYQFLSGQESYKFVEYKDFTGNSNREIMNMWISNIMQEGYEILIRDVSFLGFPSFQIIIPGLSELRSMEEKDMRVYTTRVYAIGLLRNIDSITKDNCKYIAAVIRYFENSVMENTINNYLVKMPENTIPGEDCGNGGAYLCAMCYFMCGKFDKAAYYMKRILMLISQGNICNKNIAFYRASQNYFELMNIYQEHKVCMEYLKKLYTIDICDKIDYLYCEPQDTLKKQYKYSDNYMENFKDQIEICNLYKRLVSKNCIKQDSLKKYFD